MGFSPASSPWLMADSASPKSDRDKCTVVVGQSASMFFFTFASPKYRRMTFLRLKNYSQPSISRLLCRRSVPLCRSVCLLDVWISPALIKAFLQLLILSAPVCSLGDFSTIPVNVQDLSCLLILLTGRENEPDHYPYMVTVPCTRVGYPDLPLYA